MDDRQKAEMLLDLTGHPGWAILVEENKEQLDAFRNGAPFNMKDEKELYFARGVVATITRLLATREMAEQFLAEQGEE